MRQSEQAALPEGCLLVDPEYIVPLSEVWELWQYNYSQRRWVPRPINADTVPVTLANLLQYAHQVGIIRLDVKMPTAGGVRRYRVYRTTERIDHEEAEA